MKSKVAGYTVRPRLTVSRHGVALFVLLVLSLFSSRSPGQSPSGPQHQKIQKLAFEAGWHFDASETGGSSQVENAGLSVSGQTRSTIYVKDPFDSKPRSIAEGEFPSWSPDGSRLAYCTKNQNAYGQIHIVNANGKGSRALTHLKTGACYPEWSPDGKEIAVTLITPLSTKLVIVDENGTLLRELGDGNTAHWSPDGKWLVFLRSMPHLRKGNSIWIMRPDGSEAKEVLEEASPTTQAGWLPTGAGIIFSSIRDGFSAVFTVDLDGKNVKKLGADPKMSWFQPVLAPDGKSLILEVAPLDGDLTKVTIVQIDAGVPGAKMLAAGIHFSVFWEPKADPQAEKTVKSPAGP